MSIITATQCTVYASRLSASAATITSSGLIPVVQERILYMTNNYFNLDDLSVQASVTFNATANSVTMDSEDWEDYGFQANDDILIYRSWRNDGIYTIESLSNTVMVLASTETVVDERFNRNTGPVVYFSVIKWPVSVQYVAAQMVYYDYDIRNKVAPGIRSRSLGPLSEQFTSGDEDEFGYPRSITQILEKFKIARFN